MQVTRENKDALNAVLNVNIVADDYKAQVDKILKDYRKSANIPGFRKGFVPMGMVKKQYGKAVLIDEVNKILQDAVGKYIQDEKLDILGNPLPVPQDDINWDGEEFNFQFELGFASDFNIELDKLEGLKKYKITVNDELVQKQVEDFASRFGKIVSQEEVTDNSNVTGTVVEKAEDGINTTATVSISDLKGKRNHTKFIGKKVGDVITLKTKSLFEDDAKLAAFLGMKVEDVKDLETEVDFTITEISTIENHEINQELFDKIYGPGAVDSEDAFRARIKEEAEKVYIQETERHFLNQVTEKLIEETEIELPKEFLTKWLKSVSENPMTDEEAAAELEKSEKGLKYQLIESKLFADNGLQITFEDIKNSAAAMIRNQMAQFGQTNMEDKEVDDIVMRVLQNQDEYTKISEQVKMEKLSQLYKEKVNAEEKELTIEEFVEEFSK